MLAFVNANMIMKYTKVALDSLGLFIISSEAKSRKINGSAI